MELSIVPDGVKDHMVIALFSLVYKRGLHKVDCGRIIKDYLQTQWGLTYTYGVFQMIPDGFVEFVNEALDLIEGDNIV